MNVESDLLRVNTTLLPLAFASFMELKSAPSPNSFALLYENATSLAVNLDPSVKFTSSRIVTVYVLKSLDMS